MSNPYEGIRKGLKINLHIDGEVHVAHACGWVAQPAFGTDWTSLARARVARVAQAWEGHELPKYVVSMYTLGNPSEKDKFQNLLPVSIRPDSCKNPVFLESYQSSWPIVGWIVKKGRRWVLQRERFIVCHRKPGSKVRYHKGNFVTKEEAISKAKTLRDQGPYQSIRVIRVDIVEGREQETVTVYEDRMEAAA